MSREEFFRLLESRWFPVPPPSPAIPSPSVLQKDRVSVDLDTYGLTTLDQDTMDVRNGSLDEAREKSKSREFTGFCSGARCALTPEHRGPTSFS